MRQINKMPLVSVIVPVHNCEDMIRKSILSALSQTVGHIELIVVDDCSIDRTPKIIEEIASSDLRIKVITNSENRGPAASRNYAIEIASGEFLAFLDGDDLWEPAKLEKQLKLMNETGYDLCYSSYDYFNKDGRIVYCPYLVPETINYNGLLKENIIGLSTVTLRRSAMDGFRFDTEIFHEDFALWLKLLRTGIMACGLREVLTHNRLGGRSANKWRALKNRWGVYRKSEGLSLLRSCVYLMYYAMAGLRKYRNR